MDMEGLTLIGTVGTSILIISGLWGIFTKAGRPGWYALIPIYNMVTLCRVCGVTGWLAVAFLIPLVNFIALIYLADKLSKVFGKGIGWTIGTICVGMITLPLLGFGEAKYTDPAAGEAPSAS